MYLYHKRISVKCGRSWRITQKNISSPPPPHFPLPLLPLTMPNSWSINTWARDRPAQIEFSVPCWKYSATIDLNMCEGGRKKVWKTIPWVSSENILTAFVVHDLAIYQKTRPNGWKLSMNLKLWYSVSWLLKGKLKQGRIWIWLW